MSETVYGYGHETDLGEIFGAPDLAAATEAAAARPGYIVWQYDIDDNGHGNPWQPAPNRKDT